MTEDAKEVTFDTSAEVAAEAVTDTTPDITAAVTGSFLESLPEDVRIESSLQDFKDVTGLAKSYVSAQKMLGNSVRIPGEDSSEDARAEFYSKLTGIPGVVKLPEEGDVEGQNAFFNSLGRPTEADGYKIDMPEGVEVSHEELNQFKQLAHTIGLTNKQAEQVAAFDLARQTQFGEVMEAEKQKAETTLRDKWGTDYPNRMKGAQVAAEILMESFPDEVKGLLNGPEGNNPALITMLSELGGMLKEQGHAGKVTTVDYGISADEAKGMIDEMRENKDHAYYKVDDPAHESAVAKMNKLYNIIYG